MKLDDYQTAQTSLIFQSLMGSIKWFAMADIDIIASITAKNNHIDI